MRRQRTWHFVAIALAALLAACDSTVPPPVPTELPGESPGDTATPTAQPSGTLPQPTAEPPAAAGLVLSEIGFTNAIGAAFIELWNASGVAVDLRDAGLALDGAALPFAAPAETLAPDGRFVIRFDYVLGEEPAPGAAHLLPDQGPRFGGGTLDLLDALGRPIDHVAWGDAPDPVRTGLGGVVPEALEADWTIGRAPGATAANDRLAWVPYGGGESTPGAANPLPGVPVLLPFSGAVFETTTAELTWYPAPGASGYRIQVASDASFGAIVREETTTSPGLSVDGLASGPFFWRVQATGPNGLLSAFTGTATFEVVAATAGVTTALARPGAGTPVLAAVEPDAEKELSVPLLDQHKDTNMLLLERNVREDQPHAWDADHVALDTRDPSDNMNCVLASVAMISAFACPDCLMSQDRIGYEVFKGRLPGPERDLNFGDGLYPADIETALNYALVTANARRIHETVPNRIWTTIRAEIDAGQPVLVVRPNGAGGSHATVVTGYKVAGGRRTLSANDPWSGLETYVIANSSVANANDWWDLYAINGPLLGRQQERSVTDDTDDDDVVDFDETERFRTDPNEVDTDDDGVHDKQDVLSTVFDATYGYAVAYRVGTAFPRMDGRDFDRDGLPNERDPDSDNGGCKDGDEDKNLGGIRDAGETWNFLAGDDPCRPLSGSLGFTSTYAVGSEQSWQKITEIFSLSARLKPDPNDSRLFLDDGSSYSYTARASGYVEGIGGCHDNVVVHRSGGGRFGADEMRASIIVEYEPGKDGLAIGVHAPWQGHGVHSNCLVTEALTDSGSFGGDDFCVGLENRDDGIPSRTFVFSCGETLGAGWFGRTWSLSGTIVVR